MKHLKENTGQVEWGTPLFIADSVRQCVRILDLDPCSTQDFNATVGAEVFFSRKMDGLALDWNGSVYLNPPYARGEIDKWVRKLMREVDARNTKKYVALVNNASDTQWFKRLLHLSNFICFYEGRITFVNPHLNTSKPLQGQVIFGYGMQYSEFYAAFGKHGYCTLLIDHL